MKKLFLICLIGIFGICFTVLPALANCDDPPCEDVCIGCKQYKFEGGAGLGSEATFKDDYREFGAYNSAGLEFLIKGQTPRDNIELNFSGTGFGESKYGQTCDGGWSNSDLNFKFQLKQTQY